MMADQNAPSSIDLGVPFPEKEDVKSIELEPVTSETPGVRGYESRVREYMPKATEAVLAADKDTLAGIPYQRFTIPYSSLPVVGPLYRSAVSAIEAARGMGEGETFGERHTSNIAWKEALDRARQQQFPKSQVASEVAGGLTAALATPALEVGNIGAQTMQKAAQFLAQREMPAFGEMISKVPGALSEIAKGGIYGGTSSLAERKPGETLAETGERTAIGTAIGAGAPVVAGAARKGIDKFGESILDPKTAVLRELYGVSPSMGPKSKGPMTPEEFVSLQQAGKDVNVADIIGAPERISKAAGASTADNRLDSLNQRLQERFEANIGNIGRTVDNVFGTPVNAFQLRDQAEKIARNTNAPLYNRAYAHPDAQNIWDDSIGRILNTNEGKTALQWADNEARKAAVDAGRSAPRNPFQIDEQGNVTLRPGETGAPLEFLDWVKRGLNKVYAEQSSSATGPRDPARQSTQEITELFTNLLKDKVPAYGDALSNAGKFIRGDNAFDAGTKFFELLPTYGRTNPGQLDAQLAKFSPFQRNPLSYEEQQQFRLGIGSWIKENPTQAAAIFKGNNEASVRAKEALQKVLGEDAYRSIDQSMRVARVSDLVREIRANVTQNQNITPKQMFLSTAAGSSIPYNYEHIINMVQSHPYMAALSGIYGLGSMGSRMMGNRRMNALLDMASSEDPAVAAKAAETLSKIAAGDTRWEKSLNKIEDTLSIYLAQQHMGEPALPVVGPTKLEERKMGRKSGGRVTAEGLVAAAERAKKAVNKTTEPLLNKDDTSVARALEVANKHIEG
ncbi:MAG: hypothetical protein AMJ56_00240 [Anaerolineae bacterium SG8_19]|nr:MAG: hypothetical protein AMJ56_00240 [Anaerolineae bacterium SG8_19]